MSGKLLKITTYRGACIHEDLRLSGKENVSGDMIRQLRVKNRMSQNDLAARVQVEGVMLERDSISRIESGTRFVADYELFVFAKVLGVDVASLLEFQEKK